MARGRSRLLDRGRADMWLFPVRTFTNERGEPHEGPDMSQVYRAKVTISTERGSYAELAGQVEVPLLRVLARDLPVSAYALIVYDGYLWDTARPPRSTEGATDSTKHKEFLIRGRNTPVKKALMDELEGLPYGHSVRTVVLP